MDTVAHPGWGAPRGVEPPHHWYNPDGRALCSPVFAYRSGPDPMSPQNACGACVARLPFAGWWPVGAVRHIVVEHADYPHPLLLCRPAQVVPAPSPAGAQPRCPDCLRITATEAPPAPRPPAAAGPFTDAEAAVWEAVRSAAAAYIGLTESEPMHPMEREEVCHAFHDIQARLAARPTLRSLQETM